MVFWQGPKDFSRASPIAVADVERIHEGTLITAPGTKAHPDNRVLVVTPGGRTRFHYGQFGVTGSAHNQLNHPVQSVWLPNGHVLITDQGNQRIIDVAIKTAEKKLTVIFGTGIAGSDKHHLNTPSSTELVIKKDGTPLILIADTGNNRVIELDTDHEITKTLTAKGTIKNPSFASGLPDGHTLITDTGNNRIVEVDKKDNITWEYKDDLKAPTRAIRVDNGNTVISDQGNDRVVIVNHRKQLVFLYGVKGKPGFDTKNANRLDKPHDVKIIGDFNGLTCPSKNCDD